MPGPLNLGALTDAVCLVVPFLAERPDFIPTALSNFLEPNVTAVDFERALWLSCHNNPAHVMFVPLTPSGLKYFMQNDDKMRRETGFEFLPKFDDKGLITAVVQDQCTKDILMLAHMNAEAVVKTRKTGVAHFYSRSRSRLWMKGETSGNTLAVKQILVDCDQDALILLCQPAGPACHTGAVSCFYRALDGAGLVRIES